MSLLDLLDDWTEETPVGAWDQRSKSRPREREQVMDRYQVVTLQAAVYVVDNDEMQASRFAGDWNAHASCELLNSGAMPRTDLDWIDLEPESGEPSPCAGCGGDGVQIDDDPESTRQIVSTCGECRGSGSAVQDHTNR